MQSDKQRSGYVNEDIVIKTYLQIHDNNDLSMKSVKKVYETVKFDNFDIESITGAFEMIYDVLHVVENENKKGFQ